MANYSRGFNPHPILKMSQPIPLGVSSVAEYFWVDVDSSDHLSFCNSLKSTLPEGIVPTVSWHSIVPPRIAGLAVAARYKIENISEDTALRILSNKLDFHIGENEAKITATEIFYDEACLFVILPVGTQNFRIDKFIDIINNKYGLFLNINNVIKDMMYLYDGVKVVNVDSYIATLR